MGKEASKRARICFAPEVVMNQCEQLFELLQEIRLRAPDEAMKPKSPSLQLDLVRAFAGYASPYERKHCFTYMPESVRVDELPLELREARAELWTLLQESMGVSQLPDELFSKHASFD